MKNKKMKNKLSIIFLHWVEENGPEKETLLSLESIFRYTYVPFELIVVSNGSTQSMNDKINNLVKTTFLGNCNEIKFVNNEINLGVSKGFNSGLEVIADDSEFISIYSNDWVCSPNWANIMIDELNKDKDIGFATACTNWGQGSMCFDMKNPNPLPKHFFDKDDPKLFEAVEYASNICSKNIGFTTYNDFVCMGWIMKREVFDKVGLMDEEIYCANDVSYTILGRNKGYTTITVWGAYIYHFYHASFSQINDRETYSHIKPLEKLDYERMRTNKRYKI